MDVGQNIFLGRWPRKGLFVDRSTMYSEADAVLKRLKVDVNSVYQRVESLSGGRQQSVAIARAISFEPRVVILDEPTANLSVMATERLLETMLELKKHGVAQIIISHRLQDIFAVGDRVMVLKRGENVGERQIRRPPSMRCWRSSSRENGRKRLSRICRRTDSADRCVVLGFAWCHIIRTDNEETKKSRQGQGRAPSSQLWRRISGPGFSEGNIAPGSLLPNEAEWCDVYGVSRTAVREAIKMLAAKG